MIGASSSSFRFAAVQVGYWLGWASIVVVLAGLAFDVHARDRWLLVGSTLAAAAGNTVAMVIPWREWLGTRRGRILLDLWCGGLIAFVALLVVGAGSSFSLLLFLAVPVHRRCPDRLAARLLARRQRGDVCNRCGPRPALRRRDGDAACPGRSRGRRRPRPRTGDSP